MCRLGVHLILFASTCALTAFAYLGSFSIGRFCDQHKTVSDNITDKKNNYLKIREIQLIQFFLNFLEILKAAVLLNFQNNWKKCLNILLLILEF